MRILLSTLFILFAFVAYAAKATPPSPCTQKCENQKKACLAQYTKEDSRSGRYVTPEGRSICYKAYNDCNQGCQKPKQ